MKKFRSLQKPAAGIIILILFGGLVLSRVFSPASGNSGDPEIRITAHDTAEHIGAYAEVCGTVVSVVTITSISGEPTFINFEEDYPSQLFTVVIWGENRPAWHSSPESLYEHRQVCVIGTIREHRGTPQIVAERPGQLTVRE
jgi:hypothetical protein